MGTRKVTKRQAEQALAQVKRLARTKYGYTDDELAKSDLTLRMDFDWGSEPTPTIVWEGGEYEWALAWAWEVKVPGVFAEPYAGWALSLYPDN